MKPALTPRPNLMAAANRYAAQLRLMGTPAAEAQSQALAETWATQRHYKSAGGRTVTHQSLRAIRDGRADMREKPVEIGPLDDLLNFSIL